MLGSRGAAYCPRVLVHTGDATDRQSVRQEASALRIARPKRKAQASGAKAQASGAKALSSELKTEPSDTKALAFGAKAMTASTTTASLRNLHFIFNYIISF